LETGEASKNQPPLKVLHLIARMNRGGTARYLARLMKSAELSTIDQLLVTGMVQGAEVEDDCVSELKVVHINSLGRSISISQDRAAFYEFKKIVKEFQPDVIHTHTFKAGVIGRLQRTNAQKIHTFHGHLFDDQEFSAVKKIVIRLIEKFLARTTDVLISVGTKVGQELRAAGIGRNSKWISIPPGVEPLSLGDKHSARKSLGLPVDDRIYVGWMARVTGVKNPHLFLEVVRSTPEISYVMAGQGDLSEEIAEIKPDNLIIVGWADAAVFLSACDLIVSTSDNEGMPIALIEAQLAGLPVIATDVGSSSEVVLDGETGIVTGKKQVEIVDAIRKVVADPELRRKLGKAAVERSLKYFDPKIMCQTHLDIYREVGKK
jgi:glycosyltransferase involved in cell wall biosynthesis